MIHLPFYFTLFWYVSRVVESFPFFSPSKDKLPNSYSPVCSVFTITLWGWYMSLPHWPARKHMADRQYDKEHRRIKSISSKQQVIRLIQRANPGVGNIRFPWSFRFLPSLILSNLPVQWMSYKQYIKHSKSDLPARCLGNLSNSEDPRIQITIRASLPTIYLPFHFRCWRLL